MVIIKLQCEFGHPFEGWFKDKVEYKRQMNLEMVDCPKCGCGHIIDLDSDKAAESSKSVVSHQEIKMISDQFTGKFSKDSNGNFYYIKNSHFTHLNDGYSDSSQNEIKDLSDEGISAILTELKDLAKDKLN